MAQHSSAGTTRNNRDSQSKRLGIKRFAGQFVKSGEIIVRQRGTRIRAGSQVSMGVDHTLFATQSGKVSFFVRNNRRYVTITSIN